MSRLLGWIVRRFGIRTLFLLALLLLALASVVLGLADVVRGLDKDLLWMVSVTAVLVGWGLAALTIRWWVAGILASAFGLGLVFVRVGYLGHKLLSTLWLLMRSQWGTVFYAILAAWNWLPKPDWLPDVSKLVVPDWTPFVTALSSLLNDLWILLARVTSWLAAISRGESVYDPVAVALVWSFALWGVSVWAAWVLRRRERAVLAVVPAGVLLMTTLSYVGADPSIALLMLGALLGLLVLIGYNLSVQRWTVLNIDFPDLRTEVLMVAFSLSLALVSVSAVAPSISLYDIIDWVVDLRREQSEQAEAVSESLGMERQPSRPKPGPLGEVHYGGLPRRHLLRARPDLSEELVMVISTGDLPPGPPEVVSADGQTPPSYYWRSVTYDVYNGRGWQASQTETEAYQAGHRIITTTLPTQRVVRQEVEVAGDVGELLHAVGSVVAVDHNYRIAWRPHRDAFAAMVNAKTYRVDSVVPVVNEEILRSVGSDYPEWVLARYLTLPDTVPPRVLSLARDLTATASTPFDRAVAIETYLRTFPYTLDIPTPPPGEDVVEYFLFDLQRGYCDYYASSMVVLARAAGLPARLAVGYTSGYYDWYSAQYIVTADKAHAWVEIYFPQYGWVSFEPTSAFDTIKRASMAEELAWSEPSEALEPTIEWWDVSAWDWWTGLLGVLGLVGGVGFLWIMVEGWWLRALKPAVAIRRLYGRLRRGVRRSSMVFDPGDTPYEFAQALIDGVEALVHEKGWAGVLQPIEQEVRNLSSLYVQVNYSPYEPNRADSVRALRAWQRLRWRLWVLRFVAGRKL